MLKGYNLNPKFPFIDLEAEGLVQFNDFDKFRDQCFAGAAKASSSFVISKLGPHRSVWKPKDGHVELMTLYYRIMVNPAHPDHAIVKDLGERFAQGYLKFKHPTLYIGTSLLIRNTPEGTYDDKHLTNTTVDSPAMAHFPWLNAEIKSWNLFEQVGRVILFISEHHSFTPTHLDYGKQDEFIWLGLSPEKKFFVLDTDGTKHFVTGRAMTFNNSDYHGSEPCDRATMSLRIDGVFTAEARQKLRALTS